MNDDTLVVILTYNEQDRITDVLKDVSKSFKNILVVDNNSEDLTVQKVKKFKVFLIKHIYNLGKSDSMKTALEF
ncbi:glycosyltransferase, partial [Candidatus Pelagibacter sp.]|nr:glycosyltransferase [Candidatus Pelagibacter sp.]